MLLRVRHDIIDLLGGEVCEEGAAGVLVEEVVGECPFNDFVAEVDMGDSVVLPG